MKPLLDKICSVLLIRNRKNRIKETHFEVEKTQLDWPSKTYQSADDSDCKFLLKTVLKYLRIFDLAINT